MNHPTSGQGDPYWYEWSVGLIRIIEMASPDTETESVTFQKSGVKGWDDVVVRKKDGSTDYIQVKHTRAGQNITFGSFVGNVEADEKSLLAGLYESWRKMPKVTGDKFIVFTNREAGMRKYQGRPPLIEYVEWLHSEIKLTTTLEDIDPPEEYKEAWQEWCGQLSSGSSQKKYDFLSSLRIETDQADLKTIQQHLIDSISSYFGCSDENSTLLLHALKSALSEWSTNHGLVDSNQLFEKLSIPKDNEEKHLSPPAPSPFFESREKVAKDLEAILVDDDAPQIVFVSACPGAGKTSLLSRIQMRRVDAPFNEVIGLRYYAFKPITPHEKRSTMETDYHVDPEKLWFVLLTQLRNRLRGKLWDYQVPVRNSLLDWQEARSHVLRIADKIGLKIGRKFVIAIDGIDHAARAGRLQWNQEIAIKFFKSLPNPEELEGKQLRFLILGQPAEGYPEYPAWLRTPSEGVTKMGLEELSKQDIGALLKSVGTAILVEEWDALIETILEKTSGTTLAVVFAVEEAKHVGTLEQYKEQIEQRNLTENLYSYYEAIWKSGFEGDKLQNMGADVHNALAVTLCMLQEHVDGELLARAFSYLGLSSQQWTTILTRVGPLVVPEEGKFKVLHNDLRVFLGSILGELAVDVVQQITSALADYYLQKDSNRDAAHTSLSKLLKDAGREGEIARIFTVDWVFEASALGFSVGDVKPQCAEALHIGRNLKDWDVMHQLACATETLTRWDQISHGSSPGTRSNQMSAPVFPLSEISVKPQEQWEIKDLNWVISDIELILRAKEINRARAILEAWFGGVTIKYLAKRYGKDIKKEKHDIWRDRQLHSLLERLGSVVRKSGCLLDYGGLSGSQEHRAGYHYEKGWSEASMKGAEFSSLHACFMGDVPRYFHNCEEAIEELAAKKQWRLVGRLLRLAYPHKEKFSKQFRLKASWLSIKSKVYRFCDAWSEGVLFEGSLNGVDGRPAIEALLALCRTYGWLRPAEDNSVVLALCLRSQFKDGIDLPAELRRMGMIAVILGQKQHYVDIGDPEAARILFRPPEIARLTKCLWGIAPDIDSHMNRHPGLEGELALQVVRSFYHLSEAHGKALVGVARPVAQTFPTDSCFESLWTLFRYVGDGALLKEWMEAVLGAGGILAQECYVVDEDWYEQFFEAAREIGENTLVESAMENIKWRRIHHLSDKDHSFMHLGSWYQKFAQLDDQAFRKKGLDILALLDLCEEQGMGNIFSREMYEYLGASAFSEGPTCIYQMLNLRGHESGRKDWLNEAASYFIGGFVEYLNWNRNISLSDKVACWCCTLAFSRWYADSDVGLVSRAKQAIFNSLDEQGKEDFRNILKKISGGELDRKPKNDREEDNEEEVDECNADSDWRDKLQGDDRIKAGNAIAALRYLHAGEIDTEGIQVIDVLRRFGQFKSMYGGWRWSQDMKGALHGVMGMVSDDDLWYLVEGAISRAGKNEYWISSVCENLQLLLLVRSSLRGGASVEAGIDRLLSMHEKWACGGNLPYVIEGKQMPDMAVDSLQELAIRVFGLFLSSRFATAIESAMPAVDAFITYQPENIPAMLEELGRTPWTRRWGLGLAEVWALTYPEHLKVAESMIASWAESGPLSQRLQAWLVLGLLNKSDNDEFPEFEYRDFSIDEAEESNMRSGGILYAPGQIIGDGIVLVGRHSFAESALKRIEATTGEECAEIARSIGDELMGLTDPDPEDRVWPESISNCPDSYCTGEISGECLDDGLDRGLREIAQDKDKLFKFAQAYLNSEEGWILRRSPEPHPDIDNWPGSYELQKMVDKDNSVPEIMSVLGGVASEAGVSDDEMVLGSCLRCHSYSGGFNYWSWYQESESNPNSDCRIPVTLSGRSFQWMMPDSWWEPWNEAGARTLCYRAAGQQHLLGCFPEIVPSRIWTSEFGWTPSPRNPYVWMSNEAPAARFEFLHGPPVNHVEFAEARPELHRWVVKKDAFDAVREQMPRLKKLAELRHIPRRSS